MRALVPLVATLPLLGCDARILQTAESPPATEDAGQVCGAALVERLTVTHVAVDADIRYKASGYDRFPEDERIAFSAERGVPRVAWLDNALARVHVTPLTERLVRGGPDVTVPGVDLGGLVAREDGFTLITRREDPGEPLEDTANGGIATAAMLVRVKDDTESWAVPLTGTRSITTETQGAARDCATDLRGRLAWNGEKYGAYFAVHGCQGDAHDSYYGDKLVYVTDDGDALRGGWKWKCSISQGMRLVPESDVFTSLCISDTQPFPGVNLVVEGVTPRLLAPEASDVGYSAARFGSVVKLTGDGGYVVSWLSRGGTSNTAAQQAADIAFLRLGADYASRSAVTWLTDTPDVAETNLHLAPYGDDRILVVWDSIEDLDCTELTCFGTYTGTHLRLMDAEGRFVTEDETIPVPPNGAEDLAVLPNGDLAWAFVEEDARNYATPLFPGDVADVPPKRTLSIAHLSLCP